MKGPRKNIGSRSPIDMTRLKTCSLSLSPAAQFDWLVDPSISLFLQEINLPDESIRSTTSRYRYGIKTVENTKLASAHKTCGNPALDPSL
jgi:hypothetical protein